MNKRTSYYRDLRSFEIRFEFESAIQVIGRFENFGIESAVPAPLLLIRLPVVKRLKPLMALRLRLASSMSDHTPVV